MNVYVSRSKGGLKAKVVEREFNFRSWRWELTSRDAISDEHGLSWFWVDSHRYVRGQTKYRIWEAMEFMRAWEKQF